MVRHFIRLIIMFNQNKSNCIINKFFKSKYSNKSKSSSNKINSCSSKWSSQMDSMLQTRVVNTIVKSNKDNKANSIQKKKINIKLNNRSNIHNKIETLHNKENLIIQGAKTIVTTIRKKIKKLHLKLSIIKIKIMP